MCLESEQEQEKLISTCDFSHIDIEINDKPQFWLVSHFLVSEWVFFKAIKDLHSHTINPSFDLNKQHLQFPTRKFFFFFKDYTGPTDWGCNWQKSSSALGCHGDDKIRQMSRPSGPGPPTAADEGTPGPMGYHDTQHLEHGGQKFHAICCK